MYVKDYRDVPAEPGGTDGLTVRWVINASQGATTFAMRVFELEPGKSSPFHQHENEHETYVLAGHGELETPEGQVELDEGSVIFIPAKEEHRFNNTRKEVMRFIDMIAFPIPIPK